MKDANSVSVIGNALCVWVSRVLMMESQGRERMMTEETIRPIVDHIPPIVLFRCDSLQTIFCLRGTVKIND